MTELSSAAIEQFRGQLRGVVVSPGEADYDQCRSIWNGMIDRRPSLVARVRGAADVKACVTFAREHDLPIAIKGGGHNIAGLALCDGGLLIDMSLQRGVWVDAERRIAHVQPGCLLGDVDRETQQYGLAAVLGFVSTTGVAGLTLGGGFGYTTRSYGWTCDNVSAFHVVTADGSLVRAADDENPDLLWALRGGGGNFGVVTGFEYDLFPLGPEIFGGAIAWRGEDAPAVLAMYREIVETAPRELTAALAMRMAPPAPWLPTGMHGKPVVMILVCHTGAHTDAFSTIARIRSVGKPIGDILGPRPYVMQQSMLDAANPPGRRYYWKSEYLHSIDEPLCDAVIEHFQNIPSPHSALIFFPIDGVLNNLPSDYSAVGNRDARFVVNAAGSWEDRSADAVNIDWVRGAWADMKKSSTGGTYLNFLTEEESGDRVRAALGANFDRLREVKAKWDPDNVFRVNKNIEPSAVAAADPAASMTANGMPVGETN